MMESALGFDRGTRLGWPALVSFGALLLIVGLAGEVPAGLGYGLFAISAVSLTVGIGIAAILLLTSAGRGAFLIAAARALLLAGVGAYVLAVFALAGHYAHETLLGRMEWHWVLFGPAVVAALVVLDVGLYRKLVANNLPTWRRYRQYISREKADPAAMRRVLIDDVLVQRSLWRTSTLRWVRHSLIFWGFVWMFATELVAVFLREGLPAFGLRDIWHEQNHPVRLAFDFMFDLSGLMMLVGCVLALVWRAMVNGTPERKFADTPTTVFLLFVIVSGFVVEGWRIAPTLGDGVHTASFVGIAFAWPVRALGLDDTAYRPLWIVHVLAACAFIAYVPLKRMVHTCATPIGRLMNSQKDMLAAKKHGVIGKLLLRSGDLARTKDGSSS